MDLTFKTQKATSLDEINAAMKRASETYLQGLLVHTEDEVVSTDFIRDERSSVFDASSGIDLNSNFFKSISCTTTNGLQPPLRRLLTYMVGKG